MTAFQPTFSKPAHANPSIQALRAAARTRFEALGFPTRRQEAWRFVNLGAVITTEFAPERPGTIDVTPWSLPESLTLVFVNGRFDPERSNLTQIPPGMVIKTLADALEDDKGVAQSHLGTSAAFDDHPFVALNTAQDLEGAFIHLLPGTDVEKTIHILYAGAGKNTVSYPRTLIVAESGARANIVESYVSEDQSLSCPVTEVAVAQDASIHHTRLQEEHLSANHLGSVAVNLGSNAAYQLSSINLGAAVARIDINVSLNGAGADASLDGLTLVGGTRQGDHHVRIDHKVGECTSTQRFRSVLDDESRAVFTGRIVVAEGAQGTDANQSSKSLVRSSDAVAFNNPQLEIYTDDVRCTHGSTVGRLDEEALFYLRARGIGRAEAEGLLTLAFAAEVLDAIPSKEIRTRLENLITTRLGTETG
ncbi:MAG: Fe-S cluster assembly protein SufD [Thermoanaerobaculales bacterium]|nr:Fe-S cluster assembly protein SufD [Thermoanaerobaculales bacterium]